MTEHLDVVLLVVAFTAVLIGYPVAITLAGISIIFAGLGWWLHIFDIGLLRAIPSRIFGIVTNPVLLAIPMFVFMGVMLEKSQLSKDMLNAAAWLFRDRRGGLSISVMLVGLLMAASTGIVGASIATLGILALPNLIRHGVSPSIAGGTVAAAGTLGQIVPPSVVLIVLADQMSNAWQQAQVQSGNFAPETISVSDLFAAAIFPGLLLVGFFVVYLYWVSKPSGKPETDESFADVSIFKIVTSFLPPLLLILAVLGGILAGIATPSEASSIGAVGSLILAHRRVNLEMLRNVLEDSVHLVSMIFLIVIGTSIFSLIFRGLGGDETISGWLQDMPGGTTGALLIVMLVIFFLGFFLEFLEITYIVVPLVAPVLLGMTMPDGASMSPVWLGVLIAINLQTSFLTPPFGLSLFYLRSVAGDIITIAQLYKGVTPFIFLQLLTLLIVAVFPQIATFLPQLLFAT